jgi:hypothetical protein
VKGDSSFLVEDFINAITSQLDRVQDALRLKAVNRPLLYALNQLTLELQIFVEMDGQGDVRFRTCGPNETGASTIHLGFTTITKPMIEENTISLAMTRSPSLDELGLARDEQKRLEQLGVRNAAQLQRLGTSTGTNAVSRLSGISVERLHQALTESRPKIRDIKTTSRPTKQPPVAPLPPADRSQKLPPRRSLLIERPDTPPVHAEVKNPSEVRPPHGSGPSIKESVFAPHSGIDRGVHQVVNIAPNTSHLHLMGSNLIGETGAPEVRLNRKLLGVTKAEDDHLVVEMPETVQSGTLEVTLHDGETLTYNLSLASDEYQQTDDSEASGANTRWSDPWEPGTRKM